MTISTYSELQTALEGWLHRSNLDSQILDFIALAEARIYRKLRIRAMETQLSSAIASGVIAVPSGYVAMKHARIDGTPGGPLTRKSDEWIYANYPTRSADGLPKFFAREADSFIFGPYPDSAYTVKGVYYKRLTALSDANPSNWFTTNAPDVLLFGALCEAAPYCRDDPRIPLWEAKFNDVMAQLAKEDTDEEQSGSPLSMTAR
jgi:hypothetical protein